MSEFFNLLFDWRELVALGVDVTIYFIMALVGTGLFVLRLAVALFGGGDSDFDMHVDDHAGDSSFTFFSLLSILAFFMGAGWMGVTCRVDWHLGGLVSAFISAAFGFGMMALASGLMYLTRRLNRTIDYDPATAVGHTGRVYLTIPESGKGRGQVEISVSGRRKILSAVSKAGPIEAFTDVVVLAAQDDETLLVEPKKP
jgi:hypothetical protein